MPETKQATRIQTSILNAAEKKILVWLAQRQPSWVTSDFMTFLGFMGSVFIAAGFILSNWGVQWLWLAIGGLVLNWYGDSLDGTMARVRNAQRPLYGYYLDHTMDIINELLMFIGVGLSPWVHLNLALLALVFYLILTVVQNINAHLRNEFNLTYAKLGPTELRMIIIIICLVFIFVKPVQEFRRAVCIFSHPLTFTAFDYLAALIVVALAVICLVYFIKDLRYYSKVDPPRQGLGK